MIYQEQNSDAQTVTTIKQIEQEIRALYSSLEEISVRSNPNLGKQNKILSKIERLQQLKTSLPFVCLTKVMVKRFILDILRFID